MDFNWRVKLLRDPYIQITPLTPDDQLELDPSGRAYEFMEKICSSDGSQVTPQSPDTVRYGSPERWLAWHDEFCSLNYTDRHAPLWKFNQECRAKWGYQGGIPSFANILPVITEMYSRAHEPRSFDATIVGLRYIISLIDDAVAKFGVPQPCVVDRYRTNAALPTMGKKGDYCAETVWMSEYRHVVPDLIGTRFQFQKSRLINQDSINNVRYVEELLARVRNWLRKYLPAVFGSWVNPNSPGGINQLITDSIDHNDVNIEGDYEHMDAGYGRACAQLILPVYERLLDPGEFNQLASYVSEVWTQPIYFGSFMLTGEHDLLSGIPITQDFETIFSAALHLGCDIVLGGKRRISLFIGDDSLLTYPRKYARLALEVRDLIHEESKRTGCYMHPDKTRFDTGDIRYCKRVYYPGAPRCWRNGSYIMPGAYPPVRTLNTIVLPERSVKPTQLVSAQLQRCDNLYGTPSWHSFVDGLYSRTRWDLPDPDYFSDTNVMIDWWDRVYGERWTPLSSVTYLYLTKR